MRKDKLFNDAIFHDYKLCSFFAQNLELFSSRARRLGFRSRRCGFKFLHQHLQWTTPLKEEASLLRNFFFTVILCD